MDFFNTHGRCHSQASRAPTTRFEGVGWVCRSLLRMQDEIHYRPRGRFWKALVLKNLATPQVLHIGSYLNNFRPIDGFATKVGGGNCSGWAFVGQCLANPHISLVDTEVMAISLVPARARFE